MARNGKRRGGNGHEVRGGCSGTSRGTTGHVQPESAGPRPSDYWHERETTRYHRAPKAARLQAELTQSATALGQLPCGAGIVIDLGAGGGLSTITFQALAAARGEVGGPPFVLGMDASPAMLATTPSEAGLLGIRTSALTGASAGNLDDATVDISNGIRWRNTRCDVLLADIGQPLPIRRSVVDGVLSVSAVQWLLDGRPADSEAETAEPDAVRRCVLGEECQDVGKAATKVGMCGSVADAKREVPVDFTSLGNSFEAAQPRLRRLFSSLIAVSAPDAVLALQFYPPKGDADFGARSLLRVARASGFLAEVVLDFPHRNAAKKWILVGRMSGKQLSASFGVPTSATCMGRSAMHPTSSPAMWCALCWPVVTARCVLLQQEDIASIDGDSHVASASAGFCPPELRRCGLGSEVRARAEQQHLEVALRLARSGRRLASSATDAEICRRIESELTPLQRDLAVALAKSLEGSKRPRLTCEAPSKPVHEAFLDESELAPHASNGSVPSGLPCNCSGDPPSEVQDDGKPLDTRLFEISQVPTRTELRSLIAERFPDVLAVLHKPPHERWTLPPPPLVTAEVTQGV